jgi:hypothetical protein
MGWIRTPRNRPRGTTFEETPVWLLPKFAPRGLPHTVRVGDNSELADRFAPNPERLRSGNSLACECSQTGFVALQDFQRIESFSSGISITFSFTASPIHSRNSCFVPATATG